MALLVVTNATTCSKTMKKGPYTFKPEPMQVVPPSRKNLTLERAWVLQDVQLTMAYRAYWTSYCYNGGPLDPNTGCVDGITQNNPALEEILRWTEKGECLVGNDCTDCWGSDARACLQPNLANKHWMTNKELTRSSNNNHFPFHTCNLSWRCGMHTAFFPTFVTMGPHGWILYTEHSNGTQINLDNRELWDLGDSILIKTKDATMRIEKLVASCFNNVEGGLACYDELYGHFIEFKEAWSCQKQFCYRTTEMESHKINAAQDIANLHAASIEDLKTIVAGEHQLNEELRYNFALVAAEMEQLRTLLRKTILSVAKIDDRLVGNILSIPARTQFLSETVFLMSPCSEPPILDSNCYKDLIFKEGRWMKNSDQTECINLKKVERLELVKKSEMWLPELKDEQYIGTASDFTGWTYYAQEKDNLNNAMEWVQNSQAITSIADIVNYPKEFLNHTLLGFFTTHLLTIIAISVLAYFLCRKLTTIRTSDSKIVVCKEGSNMRPCPCLQSYPLDAHQYNVSHEQTDQKTGEITVIMETLEEKELKPTTIQSFMYGEESVQTPNKTQPNVTGTRRKGTEHGRIYLRQL